MNTNLSIKSLAMDVWILETIRQTSLPGPTLADLQMLWKQHGREHGELSRATLTRHRKNIKELFGIEVAAPDRMHYRIMNPEALRLDTLANDLLASVQEYLFLEEYGDLGRKVQPPQILTGLDYLRPIGDALRMNRMLKVRYQKFTDTEPYTAILQPYCLKASQGRWYILAHKVSTMSDARPFQVFALDRMLSLELTDKCFTPDKDMDVDQYFHDCFGVYHDFDHYPVRNFRIRCSEMVAHYLRTLPLHHSQHEESPCVFCFHLSPSPDFIGELQRWGDEIEILE